MNQPSKRNSHNHGMAESMTKQIQLIVRDMAEQNLESSLKIVVPSYRNWFHKRDVTARLKRYFRAFRWEPSEDVMIQGDFTTACCELFDQIDRRMMDGAAVIVHDFDMEVADATVPSLRLNRLIRRLLGCFAGPETEAA